MRPLAAFLAVFVLSLHGTARAQTITQGTSFCITGTSTGASFAWFIDLDGSTTINGIEPVEPSVVNTVPNGQNGPMLSAAFVASINGNANATATGTSAAVSSPTNCFTITTGPHCAGGPNDGNACTINPNCPAGTCAAAVPPELYVGPPGNPTNCHVTTGGCTYNPTIVQVATVPTLNAWGALALTIGMLTAGMYVVRRRLAPKTAG